MARYRTHVKAATGSRGSKALRRAERKHSRLASPPLRARDIPADLTAPQTAPVAQEPAQRSPEPGPVPQQFPPDREAEEPDLIDDEVRKTFEEASALGMGTEEPAGRLGGDSPEEPLLDEPLDIAAAPPEPGQVPNQDAEDDSFSGWVPYDLDRSSPEELAEDMGIELHPDEPLDVEGKLEERDRKRWELNPASSEDYEERTRPDAEEDDDEEEK